ncbi:MAG: metalloregulator ArsR/SmtB family transcription factor [Acidimicrobiia bacterium]|nr:metalloregulator ArsR/SmtB family transcription factor [Acidimicrobiia bacterium]
MTLTTTSERREAKDDLFEGFAIIAQALASGRRVEIVEVLAQGERTVEEIAEVIGQSVANTSHHLRTLARAGLVSTRREGTHIHYRVSSDGVVDVWLGIRRLATDQLHAIEELARNYLGDRDGLEVVGRSELEDRLRRGDLVLIDVRPEVEYAAGHLPGAISIPPDRLGRLDEVLPTIPEEGDIVAYCRGPYCVFADDAIRYLGRRGRHAVRLIDGVPEWRRGGGLIET